MKLQQRQFNMYYRGRRSRVFLLDLPEIHIGRGGAAQIDLLHNDLCSRTHALIKADQTGHFIIDLDTPNGTRVNNKPITRHRLELNDRVVIGEHLLVYEDATSQAESLAAAFSGWGAGTTVRASPASLDFISSEASAGLNARVTMSAGGADYGSIVLPEHSICRIGGSDRCAIQIPRTGLFGGGMLAQVHRDGGEWTIRPLSRMGRQMVVDGVALDEVLVLEDGDIIEFREVSLQFFEAAANRG